MRSSNLMDKLIQSNEVPFDHDKKSNEICEEQVVKINGSNKELRDGFRNDDHLSSEPKAENDEKERCYIERYGILVTRNRLNEYKDIYSRIKELHLGTGIDDPLAIQPNYDETKDKHTQNIARLIDEVFENKLNKHEKRLDELEKRDQEKLKKLNKVSEELIVVKNGLRAVKNVNNDVNEKIYIIQNDVGAMNLNLNTLSESMKKIQMNLAK
ncbi:unnamed protein product [Brachionus calyciflorus]|uniref:Uncharacterized protein n=1 Tax=Brachionus calyciflorus TaxID=104777 RepID=A0A814CVA9_9BILA|nr:unnamed protein product [Brachionus calyciflorus]